MRKLRGLLLAVPLTALSSLAAASAQAGCGPREEVVDALERDYGEHPAFVGVQEHGNSVIEIFVAEEGGWTAIETFADGRACSRAYGKGWVQMPKDGPGA
jgi:hypothetical protein